MNNVVNMVNYYLIHKNADDSVVEYLKNKLNNSSIEDLIVIQIELLYTDPSDKLVNELVYFINNKINNILSNINLYELANIISKLKMKITDKETLIKELKNNNIDIFNKIKEKDLNQDKIFDDKDSYIASHLINSSQNNTFMINRYKSEIKSIEIWVTNLENSYHKKLNSSNIEELLISYVNSLKIINRDDYINKYINIISRKIEDYILNNNILDIITNIMPELDVLYKRNYDLKNEIYKLLDYYIDIVEQRIKSSINNMFYEERLILKEKINLICKEILDNSNPDDDFKVLVINNYLRYF